MAFNAETLLLAKKQEYEKKLEEKNRTQEEFNKMILKSFLKGFNILESNYRIYRSQLMFLGLKKWCGYMKYMNNNNDNNALNTTRRRRSEIIEAVNATRRIAAKSAEELEIANRAKILMQKNEASAAAEAAANPVNALQVLQEKLSMLFSDGFKRRERLRKLQNLIQAAARGDADRVSELLDDETGGGRVDLNSTETDAGLCCLVIATINGSLNVVKSCCKRGANLELTDEYGNTPLMIATKQRAITLCRVLIANGANVNAENNKHDTSLHLATRLADDCPDKLLLLLLNNGANCEWPDSTLNTPIHVASCSKERINLLSFMLNSIKNRLDDNTKIEINNDLEKRVITNGHIESNDVSGSIFENVKERNIRLSLENAKNNRCKKKYLENVLTKCVTKRGATPFMTAARYGHVTAIQLMLESCYGLFDKTIEIGDDVEAMCTGWAKYYFGEVVGINQSDSLFSDPTYDIEFDDGEIIYDVKLNQIKRTEEQEEEKEENGKEKGNGATHEGKKETKKMIAAIEDRKIKAKNITSLLNTADMYNETPIIAAAMRGNIQMVTLMLKYGANINILTDTGDTVYSLSNMLGKTKILELLNKEKEKKRK